MSKELADIQDLKTAFISYCRELGCGELYIQVCENKFRGIEAALKRLEEIDKLPKTEFYTTSKIELNKKDFDNLDTVKSWKFRPTKEDNEVMKEPLSKEDKELLERLERDFEITKIYIDEFGWVYCKKIDENGNIIDMAVYENFLPDKSYAKTCKVYETLDLLSAHLKIDEIESDYPPIKTELLLKEYLK